MARFRTRTRRAARTIQRAVRGCRWKWRHARKLRLATRGQVPGVVRCTVLRARGLALAPGCEAYVKVSILGDVGLDDDVYSGPPVLVAARTKWVDGGGRDPDWQARHGNALALPWEGASSPATQRDAMDATRFEVWLEVWGCRAAVAGSGDDVFVGAAMVSLASATGRAPRTPRTPAQKARGAREWVELYDTHGASTGMVQLSLAFIMEADPAERRAAARQRGGSDSGGFVGGALAKKIMSATRVAKRRGMFVQATPQVKSAAKAIQRARRRCVDRRVAVRDRQLDRPLQQGDIGEVLLSVLALRGLPHRTSHSVSVKVTALGLTSWTREKEQTSCTRWGSTPDLVVLPWSMRVVEPVAPGRRSSWSAAAAAKHGGDEAWKFKSKDSGAEAEEVGSDDGASGAAGGNATDEHDGGHAAAAANERARELGGREVDLSVWSRCGGGDNQLIGRASMWLDHSGSIPMLVRDEGALAPSLATLALLGEEGSKSKRRKAGGNAGGAAGAPRAAAAAAAARAPRQKKKNAAAGKAMPRFRRPAAWLRRKALLVRNDEGRVCCEVDVAVAAARSAWRLDYTRPKRAAHKRDIAAASKAPKLGVQRSLTDDEEDDVMKEPTSRRALQRRYAIRTSMAAMRWQPGVLRLFIQRIDGVWFGPLRTQPCVQVHARLVSGRGLHADIVEGWSTSALVPIDAAASSAASAARSREEHGDVFGDGGSSELSFDVDAVLLLEHNAVAVRRLRATREPCVVQIELTVEDERTVSRKREVIARCNVVVGGTMMSAMTWHALDGENASDGSVAGGALVREPPLHQLISALTCESGRILLAAEFIGADAAVSKSTPATAPTPEERAAADAPPEPSVPAPSAALIAEPTGPLIVPQTASLIIYALVARPLMLPGDFGQRAVSPSRRLRGDAAAATAAAALRAPPRAAPERLVLRAALAPAPARSHDKESAAGQTLASLRPGVSAASPLPSPLGSDASSASSDDDESGNYEWDPLTRRPIRIHWGEKLKALGVMDDPATRTMWCPASSSTVRLELHDAASLDDGYDGDVVAFVDVPLETLSNGAAARATRFSAQSGVALAETAAAVSMSLPFQQRWIQFEAVDGGAPMQVLLSSAMLTGEGSRHHDGAQDGTEENEEELGEAAKGGDALARGAAMAGAAADAGAVAEVGLLDIRIHALRGVSGLAKRHRGHGHEGEKGGSGVPEDLLIQLTMWPHSAAAPVLYMTDVSGPSRISTGGGWRRWEEKICLPVVDRYASVLRAVVVSKSLRHIDKGVAQIDIPVGKIATRSAFRHWFPLHLQRDGGDGGGGAEGGGVEGGGATATSAAKRALRKRRRTAADETPEIELSVRFVSLGDARAWAAAVAHTARLRATSSPSADRALLRAQADYLALSVVPPRIQGVLRVMVPRSATIVLGLAPELKEQRRAAQPPLIQPRTASALAESPAASSSTAARGDLASVCELFEIAVLETWIARTIASGRVPTLSVMQLQGSRRYVTTLCIISMLRQPGSVFERVVDLHAARLGKGKAKGRRAIQLPLAMQFIASTTGNDRSVSLAAGVRHCTDRRSFNLLARGVRQPKQEAQVTLNCIRARNLPRVSRAQDPMVVARLIVSNTFGRTLPASRTALVGGGGGAASATARAAHAAHSPEWGDGDALSLSAADVDTEILELTVLDKGTSAVIGIAEIPLANFAQHSSGGDDSDCARAWIPLHRRTASTVRPMFASEPWMRGEILVDFSLRAKYASAWTPPPLAATRHHHHHHRSRSRSPRHSAGGEHGAAPPFGLLRVAATVSAEALPPDDDDEQGDRALANETFALRLALTQGQWAESSSYFGRFDANGACVADVVAPLSAGPSEAHKGGAYSGSLRVTLVRCVGVGGGGAPGTPGAKRSARQNESVTVVETREIDVAPFTLMSGQPALVRVSLDGIDIDLRLEHYRAEADRGSAPVSTAAVMTPGQLHVAVVGAQGLPAFLSNTSVELTLHMHGQLDLCFEGATDPRKAHITKDDATATVRGWGFDALLDYAVAPSISAHVCGYADDIDAGRTHATPAEVQSLLTPLLEVRVLCSDGDSEGVSGGTGGVIGGGGGAEAARELGRAVFPLFSCITRSGHLVEVDLPLYKAPVASAPRGALGGETSAGVKWRASRLAQRRGTTSRASKQHAANAAGSPARGSKKPRDASSREKSSDAVRLALQFIPKDSAAWLGDLVATESVAANFAGSRRASSGNGGMERDARSRSRSPLARSVTPQGGVALASSTSTSTKASSGGVRRAARGVHLAKSHRSEQDVAARQLQETTFDSTLSVMVVEVSGVGLRRCAVGGSRGDGDAATAATCAVALWTGHAALAGTPAAASCAHAATTRRALFSSGWRGGGSAEWSEALNFNMPPLWKTTEGGLVLCNFELRVAVMLAAESNEHVVAVCDMQLPLRVVQPTGRAGSGVLDTWVALRSPLDGTSMGRVHLRILRQMAGDGEATGAAPFRLPPVPGHREASASTGAGDDKPDQEVLILSIAEFAYATAEAEASTDPIVVQLKGETANAISRHAFLTPSDAARDAALALRRQQRSAEGPAAWSAESVWNTAQWEGAAGEIMLPLPEALDFHGSADDAEEQGSLSWTLRMFRIASAAPSEHVAAQCGDASTAEHRSAVQRAAATAQPELLATATLEINAVAAKSSASDEFFNGTLRCTVRGRAANGSGEIADATVRLACHRAVIPNQSQLSITAVSMASVGAGAAAGASKLCAQISMAACPLSTLALRFSFLPSGSAWTTSSAPHGCDAWQWGAEAGRIACSASSLVAGVKASPRCIVALVALPGAGRAERCEEEEAGEPEPPRARSGAAARMLEEVVATGEVSLLHEFATSAAAPATTRVVALTLRRGGGAGAPCATVRFTLDASHEGEVFTRSMVRANLSSASPMLALSVAQGGQDAGSTACAWLATLKALFYQAAAQNAAAGGAHFSANRADVRSRLVALTPGRGAGSAAASADPSARGSPRGSSPTASTRNSSASGAGREASTAASKAGGGGGSKAIGWAQWCATIMPKLNVIQPPSHWHDMRHVFNPTTS